MGVERSIHVAKVVDSVEEGFAFVLNVLANESITAPRVSMMPVWWVMDDGEDHLRFEVAVGGPVGDPCPSP